jgi:hypothetical protein
MISAFIWLTTGESIFWDYRMKKTKKKRETRTKVKAGLLAKVSSKQGKLPKAKLPALIDAARFAHAKPQQKTKFQMDFEERVDADLRRRIIEEALEEQKPTKN